MPILNVVVEKINKSLKPYYILLGIISLFVISFIATYKWIVRPQDLSVFVNSQEVNFPSSINEKYFKVYNFIGDSCKDSTIISDAVETYQYLQNTNNFWIITLHNETSKSIKGIFLRITNVSSLSAWAVNSNFMLDEERDKLMKSLIFQQNNGVVNLNKIEFLPPQREIKIYIWGKLSSLTLGQNLLVSYEDGDAHVGNELTVYGFKAFLCEYIYQILFLIFLMFFFVYRHLIKKYTHVTH